MAQRGNSVNIAEKRYHHGDLRSSLMAEGLRLLAQRDVESLSLREVARGVGVSATSVYRHFPDKEALLTALALQGLADLGAAQRTAGAEAGGGEAGFAATGRAYVRFALANPGLFRLIFASPILAAAKGGELRESEAGALLQANTAVSTAEGDPENAVRAVKSWALVHGLAMLMLDGQVAVDETLIDRVIGGVAPASGCTR